VFASGAGSNLQALLDRFANSAHVRVVLVVSDRKDSGALDRARRAGVDAVHIAVSGRDVEDVARDTLSALHRQQIDLVALAGYLRLVPESIIDAYRGRMLNVHPALLPAFGGAGMYGHRVHEAVLAAGCRVSGATVHHVDERYDEGRILAQWPVPVLPDDTARTLAARVLRVEHQLYPAVIDAIAHAQGHAPGEHSAAPGSAVDRVGLAGLDRAAAAGTVVIEPATVSFRLGDGAPQERDIIAIARI
jgi:formyltetrahydrofolate-dependent phosphoribosylglycinamide formyltransferase